MTDAPLNRAESRLVAAVLENPKQADAATAAGMSLRTAQRLLAKDHVQAAVARESTRRLRRMTVVLARHGEAALEALGQMAVGGLPASSARVRAAIAIAELGARARETEDLDARLTRLEEADRRVAPRGGVQ